MMPILASRHPLPSRGGYSLLEIMIVLAIMTVSVSIMAPRAGAALDQMVVHTLQFDLQRQISDLRRRAFVNQTVLDLVIGPQKGEGAESGQGVAAARLPIGWEAKLEDPVQLKPDGLCTLGHIHLSNLGKRPIDLSLTERCQLIRHFSRP